MWNSLYLKSAKKILVHPKYPIHFDFTYSSHFLNCSLYSYRSSILYHSCPSKYISFDFLLVCYFDSWILFCIALFIVIAQTIFAKALKGENRKEVMQILSLKSLSFKSRYGKALTQRENNKKKQRTDIKIETKIRAMSYREQYIYKSPILTMTIW